MPVGRSICKESYVIADDSGSTFSTKKFSHDYLSTHHLQLMDLNIILISPCSGDNSSDLFGLLTLRQFAPYITTY